MSKSIYLLVLLALSGCTSTYYMGRVPQAHFTYPNSNVTPLTKVKGASATHVKLFMRPSVTSSVMTEAYEDALRKAQDADVLINVDAYYRITQLINLPIFFSRYKVDATACKQEIGKQKLN